MNIHSSETSLAGTRAARIAVLMGLVLTLPSCGKEPPGGELQHLVIISIDTLRADYLGSYGHPYVESPHIDAQAAGGFLFENHVSSAPTTLASHTALTTGTWPHTHGVPRNGFVVRLCTCA